MKIPVYQVDAFTTAPFGGNPAAVCILDREIDDESMKAIAAEMNVSETAFVYLCGSKDKGHEKIRLRWFSPEMEMPLCGHATLAASKVLFEELVYEGGSITFDTLSGDLTVNKSDQGLLMDFPLDELLAVQAPEKLLQAMGIGSCREAFMGKDTSKLVLVMNSTDEVKGVRPDYTAMKDFAAASYNIKGVGVTAKGDAPYDFTSRYFNPWAGVNEDPVTGSVHTVLAGYWSDRLGKDNLKALQASRRQGEIVIRLNKESGRVEFIGDAVTVLKGDLYI